MSKSRCTKHTSFGPLLEVETSKSALSYGTKRTCGAMLKKCTQLWPEAFFEVDMYKTEHIWSTFGSWPNAPPLGKKLISKSKVSKTSAPEHFLTFRCGFAGCKGFTSFEEVMKRLESPGSFNYSHHTHYTMLPCATCTSSTTTSTIPHYTALHASCNWNTTTTTTATTTSTTPRYTTRHWLHTLRYITLHSAPLHWLQLQLQVQLH